VFAIYVILLVTRWLRDEIGGLDAMDRINTAKADMLYQALDRSCDFYQARAHRSDRSKMNVAFTLSSPELESQFLAAAAHAGMSGLAGHRSVGGIRASLYNGLTISAVETLVSFMEEFRARRR
jgi:phosphoserine aminotransferase